MDLGSKNYKLIINYFESTYNYSLNLNHSQHENTYTFTVNYFLNDFVLKGRI